MNGRVCEARTCFFRAESDDKLTEQWGHGCILVILSDVGLEAEDLEEGFLATLVGLGLRLFAFFALRERLGFVDEFLTSVAFAERRFPQARFLEVGL